MQGFGIKIDGYIDNDGGQLSRQKGLFLVFAHFFAQLAFDFIGPLQNGFHRTKFLEQLYGGFFSHTGNSGNVIYGIAHEPKQVNYLLRTLQIKFFAHFFGAEHLVRRLHASRPIPKHFVGYQLPIIFVGGHHIGGKPFGFGFAGQGAYNVVGFVALHNQQ